MTDQQRGILRTLHTLDQCQAKALSAIHRGWKVGDRLRCLDDSNGAHFLRRGHVFTITHIQHTDDGSPVLFLDHVAIGWEPERFERI